MNFAAIPQNASVFVDANTFVYHFSQHPVLAAPCTEMLDRVARGEILGISSAAVLSDVSHRLMVLEAAAIVGWTTAGTGRRLRQHPNEIQKLLLFHQAIQDIRTFGIQVLLITYDLVEAAAFICRRNGILSGDALIVASMQNRGLTLLASHDGDFDRVPGITRFGPL